MNTVRKIWTYKAISPKSGVNPEPDLACIPTDLDEAQNSIISSKLQDLEGLPITTAIQMVWNFIIKTVIYLRTLNYFLALSTMVWYSQQLIDHLSPCRVTQDTPQCKADWTGAIAVTCRQMTTDNSRVCYRQWTFNGLGDGHFTHLNSRQ